LGGGLLLNGSGGRAIAAPTPASCVRFGLQGLAPGVQGIGYRVRGIKVRCTAVTPVREGDGFEVEVLSGSGRRRDRCRASLLQQVTVWGSGVYNIPWTLKGTGVQVVGG